MSIAIYHVEDTAWEPFKTYLVFVSNRGWTDGSYRTDDPKGWCHKWASELFSVHNRGVTHYMEMPDDPNGFDPNLGLPLSLERLIAARDKFHFSDR